jgi:hypothetical protein
LFCDRTDLTLEHVWPDWVSKFLFGAPERGRFTATRFEGAKRSPVGKPFKASELNHKARVVCARCNNGWMSEVETHAKGVLRPLLRGDDTILNQYDQATLRAWVVLRSMILERAASAALAVPFYTDSERRTFADIEFEGSLEPMDGTYIWAFQYRSPRWVARSHVANAGLHMVPRGPQTHRLQIVTGFVGHFGFQVLVGRWPKHRRLEFNSHAVRNWHPAMALLWPHASESIDWPPGGFYLGDDSYEPILDRFMRPGFPLASRRRRRGR